MRLSDLTPHITLTLGLLAIGPTHAQDQHAHVHGLAQLNLAVEGNTVSMELTATAYDLVGFERAPRDDAERARIADARRSLLDHATLWQFNAAAGCVAEAPVLAVPGAGDHDHDHEGHDYAGHSDWQVRYRFQCKNPAALRAIEIGAFKRFPSLETIDVQFLTAHGATALTVLSANPRIALAP
jgi:hypothetical protein